MKVELELNDEVVFGIEKLLDERIKDILEREINENGDEFIEKLGYNNF